MSRVRIGVAVAVVGYLAAAVTLATWLPKVYARHAWLTSVPPVDV